MNGVEHIIFERKRHFEKGFNDQAPENANGELVECAGYILGDYMEDSSDIEGEGGGWPVERAMKVRDKYGKDYVARLRIAASLIAAEIDRIQLIDSGEAAWSAT